MLTEARKRRRGMEWDKGSLLRSPPSGLSWNQSKNYLNLSPSWSPCYSDLFAAGYGSFDFYSQSEAHSKQNHHYDKDDGEDNDYNSCRAATSPCSPWKTQAGRSFFAQRRVASFASIYIPQTRIWCFMMMMMVLMFMSTGIVCMDIKSHWFA